MTTTTLTMPSPLRCQTWLAVAILLLMPAGAFAQGSKAPPAKVEEPPTLKLSELPYPSDWTWIDWKAGGLDYRVDLDLLAPLGTGGGNLAIWLDPLIAGSPKAEAALRRAERLKIPGLGDWSPLQFAFSDRFGDFDLLPFDDPLLLEAEPWIDQRTCRFFPDVFFYEDIYARPFHFRLALLLGRTWVARGLSRTGTAAKADVRRAIRLGRLLLQDDVMVEHNLIGIALIRAGAAGLYALALRGDDGDGRIEALNATLATLALLDSAALNAEIMRRRDIAENVRAHLIQPRITGRLTGPVLEMRRFEVENVVKLANGLASRALRLEALNALYLIRHMGSRSHSERAAFELGRLAGVADPMVAAAARTLREREFDKSKLFPPHIYTWPTE